MCIAAFLLLIHEPLLHLPYFWDELGQFIPASLDLFNTGAWIPRSTLPNVHPPGVMAWLAGFWWLFGYSIAGTRVAMLLVAAAGALVGFLLAIELSRGMPRAPAFAALACLIVSPLFVAQSMLAQLDMPAMSLTSLALLLFLQNRWRASGLVCVALVLVKETGIVAPALFGCWLLAERQVRAALWFLLPLIALLGWLFVLKSGTGHWFGNQAFTQYNLYYPLHPIRLALALLRRIYFLFIGGGHFLGTGALIWAYRRVPVFHDRSWRVAMVFLALHTVVVSALGGAVLERYLMPVLPLVYIAFAISFSTLPSRTGTLVMLGMAGCLVTANFVNPIYPFPLENNLAFVSFVNLQVKAAAGVEGRPGTLATTFPMADAFRRPEFGFVLQPRAVVELESFEARNVERLAGHSPDLMLVYDPMWDPMGLFRAPLAGWLHRYYDYEPALSPDELASRLSMHVARRWEQHGMSMSLLAR